jgi:poly-gamma-glutamate synthesis protein (capsule biosynthesis protein)
MDSSEQKRELTLVATGDSLIMRRMSVYGETDLVKTIRDADVAFTNCETTIHNYKGYPGTQLEPTAKVAAPHIAEELAWMGFDILSFANNHCMDYGIEGMLATCENLDRAGLVYAGVGRNLGEARIPAFLDTAKGRVALVAAYAVEQTLFRTVRGMAGEARPDIQGRPGVNPLRYETYYAVEPAMLQQLKNISSKMRLSARFSIPRYIHVLPEEKRPKGFWFLSKRFVEAGEDVLGPHTVANDLDVRGNLKWIKDAAKRSDFAMASLHSHVDAGGGENPEVPGEIVPPFARACIDAGAKIFIGHGPHVLQGIEIYKGHPIFYSLGNFILQTGGARKYPADIYEEFGLGFDATPSDSPADYPGFTRLKTTLGEATWEGVIARCTFKNGELSKVELYPVTLNGNKPAHEIGTPELADEESARRIVERLKRLSSPYGTEIEFANGIGIVELNEKQMNP